MRKTLTLIELTISAAILILASTVLALLFTNSIILNEFNRNRTRALSHAQYVMEEIKDADFSTLASDITAGNWDWDTAQITSQGLASMNSETVDASCNQISSDFLDITVTAQWLSRAGRPQNIAIETLIVEP